MEFPILEQREYRTSGTALCGMLFLLLGTTGISGSSSYARHWHWPWSFDEYRVADVIFAGLGAGMLLVGGTQWLRAKRDIRAWNVKTGGDWYARATLPRSIFQLLLTVATADGRVDGCEGAAIETFLLRRMQKGLVVADLRNWTTTVSRAADPRRLAQYIGRLLDAAERQQLYGWCEDVALADGGIDDTEREVLAAIAQGLQIAAPARALRP